ncbi:MAG: hypothetical protein ABI395_01030 [Sphingobium sp.]
MVKSKDDTLRKYREEDDAKKFIIAQLSDRFKFWLEVNAVGMDGDKLRIDAVSLCTETGWYFGWEFKKSHLYKSEFAYVMRQAINYRLARIQDSRISDIQGSRLRAIAVFPDWLGEHDEDDTNYGKEAEGMRLLAAQFRVGTMREREDGRLSFIMGQNGIWHSTTGWTKTAPGIMDGERSIGSQRRKDK